MGNAESRSKARARRRSHIRAKERGLTHEDVPRFVVDVMLGRLAKWLRIVGFDALYSNRYSDEELVRLSQSDSRVLLTRDTRLLVQKAVTSFIFVESEKVSEQMAQVLRVTGSNTAPGLLTRCLHCNVLLAGLHRDRARDRVPPYVFRTQTRFKTCPNCGKVYWPGTHRVSIFRELSAFR